MPRRKQKDSDPAVSTDPTEIEVLIGRVKQSGLPEHDALLVERLLRLVLTLVSMLEHKNTSIARLKRMLFGPRTEKRDRPSPPPSPSEAGASDTAAPSDTTSADATPPEPKPKAPGHGRMKSARYTGAETVRCGHVGFGVGERCPDRPCSGHLYDTNAPSILIRLTGQSLVGATRYEQQVLRCSACQTRFTAPLPEGVPPEKYDATADVAIAMAKYSAGLPFYRLARVQAAFGVPLPESVQWERVESVADAVHPVFLHLMKLASRGEVLFADDTSVKILACIRENKQKGEGERTGTYTTGIVSRVDGYEIAIYRSGRAHAGENVGQLLEARPAGLPAPVQIGDALASNWSHTFTVIVAKCLAHARRHFVDIETAFPDECKRVLDDLARIYRNDDATSGKTAAERLAYHQKHSAPVMESLRAWIEEQFEEQRVEPNSSLGKVLTYMLKHWAGLTRYLEDGRAPLDTNAVERILELVVLNRKNSLFFRTEHGAAVGDIIASLVESCRLNDVGAWEYLVALVRNAQMVRKAPAAWLPWNYPRDGTARRAA
jgi:transposase